MILYILSSNDLRHILGWMDFGAMIFCKTVLGRMTLSRMVNRATYNSTVVKNDVVFMFLCSNSLY
jgi:hypothetical protein